MVFWSSDGSYLSSGFRYKKPRFLAKSHGSPLKSTFEFGDMTNAKTEEITQKNKRNREREACVSHALPKFQAFPQSAFRFHKNCL